MYLIGQGHAMNHPSVIDAGVLVDTGQITRTRVRGQATLLFEEHVEGVEPPSGSLAAENLMDHLRG